MLYLRDIRLFLTSFRLSELPPLETVESHSLHGHRPMVASGTINVGLPTNRRDDVKRELRDTWSPIYFFSRD